MSVTITVEAVRPTQLIDWFLFPKEHGNHFSSLLANNGILYSETISQDGLTQTRKFVFADQTAADTFFNDPAFVLGFEAQASYNLTNGITKNTIVS